MPTLEREKQVPPWIRIVREPRAYYRQITKEIEFDCPEVVCGFLSPKLAAEEVEVMVVLVLNNRLRLLGAQEIARGSADATLVCAREVFRLAILLGGTSIIVAHNHISGNPSPSDADVLFTQRIECIGDLIGIPLRDHVVIGSPLRKPEFVSMKNDGLVKFDRNGAGFLNESSFLKQKANRGAGAAKSIRAAK